MVEYGKDFIANEFGEIVQLKGDIISKKEQTPTDKMQAERSQLEYEVFSHPERWTAEELAAKKARYEELTKILNIKKIDTLAAGKEILKKRLGALNMAAMQQGRESD